MIENSAEKKLLLLVKYAMPLVTILVSFIFTLFMIFNNIEEFKKDSKDLKDDYIKNQKVLMKSEVKRVYDRILKNQTNVRATIKKNIKNRINESYEIAMNIYKEHKNKKTNNQIIKLIGDSLRGVKFNENRGYYYIFDLKGNCILYPPNRELENNNYLNYKDPNGFKIIKESIKIAKTKKEGYLEFQWKKPKKNKFSTKLSYIKAIDELGIYIGTGEYIKDFEDSIKKKTIENLQNLRYGLNNFVFLVDYKGTYLSHLKNDYVGLNRIDLQDKNGTYITKKIIDTAKSGDGFISYISTIMPETNKPAQKTTYVKGFNKWEIAIASGFYNKKIEEQIVLKERSLNKRNSEYILKILFISIIITIFLFGISLYVSYYLEKYFLKYRKKIFEEIEKNKKKDLILAHQTKMVAMGEMIENIAHQWRQPLSVITTSASGMQLSKEMGILSDENQKESLDIIILNANHLSQTIDDFRNFLSTKHDAKTFEFQVVYDKTLKLISSKLKSNEIQIDTNIEDIKIKAYENELIQVLMNLFNNSLDAFKIKKIKNKKINFNVFKKSKNVIIEFSDNAGGIDEELITRIFEPYFTTKHKFNGTGIGLYMSQQIINKQFNGEIKVKNIKKEESIVGVMFTIKLPIN
ncbi:Cache sensor-containing signal transduction histidine kinase [Malaciobacter marinus]|uniref:histidine kinase n=1 Tax=Malaciobacter marinus TaxID=505249 RepID=A0A347TKT9_9BACT|nr:cache domain-containing protein [Malaciobacter marinus]AXX87217.1 Cache sensor-containing signal transduction histidine kinase [Malaciobacter marinus]PHO14878.1 histidine kinase [Malaciobacter marinus]